MSRTAIGWGGLLLACAMGAAMQQGGGTGRFQIVEVNHDIYTIEDDGKPQSTGMRPVVLLLNTETGETRRLSINIDNRAETRSEGAWMPPLVFIPAITRK